MTPGPYLYRCASGAEPLACEVKEDGGELVAVFDDFEGGTVIPVADMFGEFTPTS